MRTRTLDGEMWLPLDIQAVFAFFSNAENLEALTPPWVRFDILTPKPIVLAKGALIDYQLRIHHVPIRWRTEITVWNPPIQFVDEQLRGPYKLWVHRHDFEERDGGTWVRDHVDYRAPGWILEPIINRVLVARDLRAIFTYRQQRIRELLAPGSAVTQDRIVLG